MSSSTSSSSRPRLGRLLLGLAGGLLLIGAGVAALGWQDAVEAGRRELEWRKPPRIDPVRAHPERPLLVFLGDSTFLPGHSYPRLIARWYGRRVETQILWWAGLEPFHHYLLSSRVAELDPTAVVIVAQTRIFWKREPLWYADLMTQLPPSELPRAMRLPFHARGVTLPRLALASLLGTLPGSEELVFAWTGVRELARDLPAARWIVPASTPSTDPRNLQRHRLERFMRYARPIRPGHPALAALAATVERTVRGGARTLVLVSPVPVDRLSRAGLYDGAAFAEGVGAIARAVEGEGGELLDLHAILAEDDFTDQLGHMSESGTRKVATVVEPWLRKAIPKAGRGGR
ncbi:MAG: hypothetical protein ACQGVC_15160 [Myxococcota bacterium]